MVAIVTGQGLGVERGSGFVLGSRGQLGDASFGTNGDNVTVNAATGNLNITRTDDILIGLSGINDDAGRAYNSMGAATDDNHDNWSIGNGKTITHVVGTINTAGSTVTRMDWDGSDTLYTYDAASGLYIGKQGTGARDTLGYSASAHTWSWTDGTTQLKEVYTVAVNPNDATDTYWATLTSATDNNNMSVLYYWSGNKLTSYIDGSDWVLFTYSGNNLTQVSERDGSGTIITNTYYSYDTQNRLIAVSTDLSPTDNSTADGKVATTSYTYVGTTNYIATIGQWTGWSGTGTQTGLLEIFYDGSNRVSSYRQTQSSGITATTTLTYTSSTQTTVTDAYGNVTTLTYDGNKQLTQVDYPANGSNTPSTHFIYDANGKVTSATDGAGNATTYGYDTSGNLLWVRSPTGDETTYTYDANNRVLTKTDYFGRDPDAGGTGSAPTLPTTTRYVYDSYGNLNYEISGAGEVTEYDWYQPYNELTSKSVYSDYSYSVSGLSPGTAITQANMTTWLAGVTDKSNNQRVNYYYDGRNQLHMSYTYAGCNADGTGNSGKPISITSYTHDQFGNLLTRQIDGKNVETFHYDGLNRMTMSTDIDGQTTTYAFTGWSGPTTITSASGMSTVSTYNMFGQLISTQVSGADIATGLTSFAYDKLGNLTMVTDAAGNKSFHLYDVDGNKIADVAADGSAVQYIYTKNGQLRITIRFANRVSPAGLTALASTSAIGATFASMGPYFTLDTNADMYEWRFYDADDKLIQVVDSGGDVTNFTPDGLGNTQATDSYRNALSAAAIYTMKTSAPPTAPVSITADTARDMLVRNWYDADDRLIGTLDGDNHLTTYTYNRGGELAQTTSYANAVTWNATFSSLVITPDATHDKTTQYFYDGRGLMVYSLDDNLVPTEYDYDWYTSNLLGTITYGAPIASTATYTAAYIAAQITALSLKTNADTVGNWVVYDAANRVIETIDGAGDATIDTYNSLSNLATSTAYANALSAASVNSYKTTAPTTLQTPTADAAHDRVTSDFYDVAGRLAGSLDADKHLTLISYDAYGNTIRQITYANAPTTLTGTLAAIKASVTANAALDHDVQYFYDADERLQYTLTNLTPTEYRYDGQGHLTRTIQYDGQITAGTFTSAYIATQITSHGLASLATTRTMDQVYDLAGRLAFSIDGSGAVTQYVYDGRGLLMRQTQFSAVYALTPGATQEKYEDLTNPTSGFATTHASDAGNRNTRYYYDAAGHLTVSLSAEGQLTSNAYDYAGRLTLQTRFAGVFSATDATDLSTLVPGVVPSSAEQTKYSYDSLGRLTDSYDGLNVDTRTVYDAQDRVKSVTVAYGTADAATTSYTYDAAGRVLTITDPVSNVTTYTYDAQGNVKSIADGNGYLTTYTYDALGNVLTKTIPVSAGVSATATYQYNAFGQVIVTTDALGHASYNFFNNIGKLAATVDGQGYYVAYTYDSFGDLKQTYQYFTPFTGTVTAGVLPAPPATNAKDAITVSTYDGVGRMLTATDAESHTETWTYNAFGQVATDTNKLGGVTTNTYDRRGLLLTQTKAETSYTAAGTVEASTVQTAYTYDDFGNALTMTEASGLGEARATAYGYDHDNQLLTSTTNAVLVYNPSTFVSAGTAAATTTYKYDNRGNVIEAIDPLGNTTFTYYDAAGRKIAAVNALNYLSTWVYDHAGNVTAERVYATAIATPTAGGTPPAGSGSYRETTYTYDRADELLTTTVAGVQTWQVGVGVPTTASVSLSNTYDLDGNLIMQTDGNGQHVWFFYDKRGEKIAQVDQLSYLTTYALDDNGNVLTETRYATAVTTPTSSPSPSAPPVAPTGTSNANDRITNFTYDRMGRRLTEQRMNVAIASLDGSYNLVAPTTGNATITYTYNAMGEVLSKQEATGDTTNYVYDSFGRQTSVTGAGFTDVTGTTDHDTTTMYYDGLNDLVRSVDNSRVTTFVYDKDGNKTSQTDATGFQTQYFYDLGGHIVVSQYIRAFSNGTTTATEAQRLTYDALGHVIKQDVATLAGGVWSAGDSANIQYDAFGEITAKGVNGLSQETDSYDNTGRVIRSTDGDGTVKFYLYDPNGNQTAVITSDGTALAGGYSWSTVTEPQLLSLLTAGTGGALGTSALGSVNVAGVVLTFTTYDARGMATLTTMPFRAFSAAAASTLLKAQTYNAFGEIITQTDTYASTDPTPPTTTFTYNTLGKVTSSTLPAMTYVDATGVSHANVSPVTYNYYDASGRLIATTDADGHTNTRALLAGSGYDGADALEVLEKHADGGLFKTYYDVNRDAVKKSTNGAVGAGELDETYVYDAMNRVTEVDHVMRAIGSAGNLSGQTQQLIDTYSYDGLGQRLKHTAITKLNGVVSTTNFDTTDYDLQGRVTKTADMDGVATTTSYNWVPGAATALGTTGGWEKITSMGATTIQDEIDDYFGREVTRTDNSAYTYNFAYDTAGRQITETSPNWVATQQIATSYYNTGQIKEIWKGTNNTMYGPLGTNYKVEDYTYDAAGNRLTEVLTYYTSQFIVTGGIGGFTTVPLTLTLENATSTWDDDHHLLSVNDSGAQLQTAAGSGVFYSDPAAISYAYDLNGNIRHMTSSYDTLAGNGTNAAPVSENYWYTYDAMNRFVVTKGILSGTTIIAGTTGETLTYNYDSTRATVANGVDGTVETDAYTSDGLLAKVTVGGVVRAQYGYDARGRDTNYTEYNASGVSVYNHTAVYDPANVLNSDHTSTTRGSSTTVQNSTYTYNAIGQVATVATGSSVNGGAVTNSSTAYTYTSYNGQNVTTGIVYTPNTATPGTTNNTNYYYNSLDELIYIQINDGNPRTLDFETDINGQILRRDQIGTPTVEPHEVHFYFDGIQIGDVSNDGPGSDLDYAQEIADRTATQGTGVFHNGATTATAYANFDQNYNPLNGYDNPGASSSYSVVDGDTLQSIAEMEWGDSSLWYIIADANGLSASDTLAAGMSLIIPNKVMNVSNNSSTFKPYDPNAAIGNVDPTVPKQQKHSNNCGVFGMILLAVIAIAVTFVTAGLAAELLAPAATSFTSALAALSLPEAIAVGAGSAAVGSIVSQGVGLATGIQTKFDWGAVGLAALGGAISGGLGPNTFFGANGAFGSVTESAFINAALRGAVGSVITQGIGVATGLQKSFDWAGVAAAGIGSGVTAEVTGDLGEEDFGLGDQGNGYVAQFVGGVAGDIASAATTTLIKGTDFGDNLVSALPDTIGTLIGTVLGDVYDEQDPLWQKLHPDTGNDDAIIAQAQQNAADNEAAFERKMDQDIANMPVDLSSLQSVIPSLDGSSHVLTPEVIVSELPLLPADVGWIGNPAAIDPTTKNNLYQLESKLARVDENNYPIDLNDDPVQDYRDNVSITSVSGPLISISTPNQDNLGQDQFVLQGRLWDRLWDMDTHTMIGQYLAGPGTDATFADGTHVKIAVPSADDVANNAIFYGIQTTTLSEIEHWATIGFDVATIGEGYAIQKAPVIVGFVAGASVGLGYGYSKNHTGWDLAGDTLNGGLSGASSASGGNILRSGTSRLAKVLSTTAGEGGGAFLAAKAQGSDNYDATAAAVTALAVGLPFNGAVAGLQAAGYVADSASGGAVSYALAYLRSTGKGVIKKQVVPYIEQHVVDPVTSFFTGSSSTPHK